MKMENIVINCFNGKELRMHKYFERDSECKMHSRQEIPSSSITYLKELVKIHKNKNK
jgi:hypothetical protein